MSTRELVKKKLALSCTVRFCNMSEVKKIATFGKKLPKTSLLLNEMVRCRELQGILAYFLYLNMSTSGM